MQSKTNVTVCRECGKEYERTNEQNNGFCSERCRHNYRKKHPNEKDYQKICRFCGQTFGTNNQADIYCSLSCRKKAEPWKYPYECVCQYCGELFMAKTEDSRFCSSKCAACFHADETRKPPEERPRKKDSESIKICRQCGREYYSKRRGREDHGFCSKSCADKYRYYNNDKPLKYEKICECCGTKYETNRMEQRYCSRECAALEFKPVYKRVIHCAVCGVEIMGATSSQLYCQSCSAALEQQQANERRRLRRQQIGDSHGRQVKLSKVYSLAGGVCEICGLPVPINVDSNDEWAATRDHIIPVSKAGSHTYFNCQLAHRICNSCKGDHGEGWSIDWDKKIASEPGKWEEKLSRLLTLIADDSAAAERLA